MAKTHYAAIDANGTTHTRNSDRVYTHTVVARYNKAGHMARATAAYHTDADGRNHDYHVELASGAHAHVTRVTGREGYHVSYTDERVAEMQAAQREQNAKRIEDAKATIDGRTRDQYIADQLAARIAKVEATDFNAFHNLGWCGRYDLAQKLAAKEAGDWWTDCMILEAITR